MIRERLGLELMPFEQAPSRQAMIPSRGKAVLGLGPRIQYPHASSNIFLSFKICSTIVACLSQFPPKSSLHSWKPLVHKSHIKCTSPWSPKTQSSIPLNKLKWHFRVNYGYQLTCTFSFLFWKCYVPLWISSWASDENLSNTHTACHVAM